MDGDAVYPHLCKILTAGKNARLENGNSVVDPDSHVATNMQAHG